MKETSLRARLSGQKGTIAAGVALASFAVLVSCNGHAGQTVAPDKPVPALIQNQKRTPERAAGRKGPPSDTVPWENGECTVTPDKIVYTSRNGAYSGWKTAPRFVNVPFPGERTRQGGMDLGMPLFGANERIIETLCGWKRTVILTDRSLVFTSGADYAFAKMEPTLLTPVATRDFFFIRYDVSGTMKRGLLGWTVNEKRQAFLLSRGGIIEAVGTGDGKSTLSFSTGQPMTNRSALRLFGDDLLIAHPGSDHIVVVENAATKPFLVLLRTGKALADGLRFVEHEGGLILKSGADRIRIRIRKNQEGKLDIEK